MRLWRQSRHGCTWHRSPSWDHRSQVSSAFSKRDGMYQMSEGSMKTFENLFGHLWMPPLCVRSKESRLKKCCRMLELYSNQNKYSFDYCSPCLVSDSIFKSSKPEALDCQIRSNATAPIENSVMKSSAFLLQCLCIICGFSILSLD